MICRNPFDMPFIGVRVVDVDPNMTRYYLMYENIPDVLITSDMNLEILCMKCAEYYITHHN